MHDINSREDIKVLVETFYKKVVQDDLISHFFTRVAHFSWEVHIPIMVNFWESIILNPGAYSGNPMIKHFDLHKLSPMEHNHFERWLQLWKETVNEFFTGPNADTAISRATSIAGIMEYKIGQQ